MKLVEKEAEHCTNKWQKKEHQAALDRHVGAAVLVSLLLLPSFRLLRMTQILSELIAISLNAFFYVLFPFPITAVVDYLN